MSFHASPFTVRPLLTRLGERRHGGGLRQFASGLSQVLRIRLYVAYMLTAALSGATMMAYIANSSYVLQEQKGLRPPPFALFFASTALAQILLSVLNAKILGRRFQPRTLIGFGLTLSTLAIAALTAGVFALDTPLLLTCGGFLILLAASRRTRRCGQRPNARRRHC